MQLRTPEDEKYFRFSLTDNKLAHIPEYSTDNSLYRIPYDDNFFDFVFSVSVLEHVMDYNLALSEMARVMKPGGVAIHIFPPRHQWIEPHMNVPLGGYIQNLPWFLFWAILGVRNNFQDHLGPLARARINLQFTNRGLNYIKLSAISQLCQSHFSEVRFIPEFYETNDGGYFTKKGCRIVHSSAYRRLYNNCEHVVLFLRKALNTSGSADSRIR